MDSGALRQVIPGHNIWCLYDGRGCANRPSDGGERSGILAVMIVGQPSLEDRSWVEVSRQCIVELLPSNF